MNVLKNARVKRNEFKSLKSDDVSKIHLNDEESISRGKNARSELYTNPSHTF